MSYIQGVVHVNFTVEDNPEAVEKARYFYGEILGLEQAYRPPNTDSGRPGAWFNCGNQQIHISMEKNAPNYNAPSRRHAAFTVSDIEGMRQQLEKNGIEIIGANQFEGQKRFFCRDYWGNRLEFVEFE